MIRIPGSCFCSVKHLLNVLNERDKFSKKFNAEELLAIILLALMFLTVVGLEFKFKFYLSLFEMEGFYYNIRCRTKDHLILEVIYEQCDSDYYISFEKYIIGLYYDYR